MGLFLLVTALESFRMHRTVYWKKMLFSSLKCNPAAAIFRQRKEAPVLRKRPVSSLDISARFDKIF